MGYYIYDKLKYIALGVLPEYRHQFAEYKYVRDEAFDHDLRYLRDHGYLEMFQLSDLAPGENLVGKLRATEMGLQFVRLKERGLAAIESANDEYRTHIQDKEKNNGTHDEDTFSENGTRE